jgi:periplasmic divalent cation tolerance protein
MHSIYRWRGKIETANEQLLIIKGAQARLAAVMDRIRALHPYELPEIVAVPIAEGLPDYLAWLHHPE